MQIGQHKGYMLCSPSVEVFRDAGCGTACAGAEVDADGGGEFFGGELVEEDLGADFGGG